MTARLYDYQLDAVNRMRNGCILCGGVGSGKSRTSLAYYYLQNGGNPEALIDNGKSLRLAKDAKALYIITTARKRDTLEWSSEIAHLISSPNGSVVWNRVIIDSWNNVLKYKNVVDAFFIFDEQRVIGSGVWVKSFLKIARFNQWILLSATPGDTWQDYIPVFVANGFYRNRTEFSREHIVYSRFSKFPKVDRYINTGKLIKLRNKILIDMDFKRETVAHHEKIYTPYDINLYKNVSKTRWDPYKNEPIINAAGLCFTWRRLVNSSTDRSEAVLSILEKHQKIIIFYNFNYELDILKSLNYGTKVSVAEWNGHKHQPIPGDESWVYLVQYTAGCEGWNCIETDTIIFYSQNYSYKVMQQASGRIDRLNTPFTDLYYYHLLSRSGIDLAIGKALHEKKAFNERKFVKW